MDGKDGAFKRNIDTLFSVFPPLILKWNKTALNMFPYQSYTVKWSSKYTAEKCLSFPLHRHFSSINLRNLDRAPGHIEGERFKFHLFSPRIPSLLLTNQNHL